MKYFFCFLFALSTMCCSAKSLKKAPLIFYKANDPHLKYVGRIDFSDPLAPKFWAPGIYVEAKFKGTSLYIDINDEDLYGSTHNYLEIAIDNNPPFRIQTTGKTNHIKIADNLSPGVHTVIICKDTESNIGYISFAGLTCEKLLAVSTQKRKIEYIGDSITCGTGSDQSVVKCDKGNWYDQHNAYMSYGPTTSRALDAEWHLTSISGLGLIHSCCNMQVTLPQIFDKVVFANDSIKWDFNNYIPDVVTICIGQNDGKQDSTVFCSAYVNFIKDIRSRYPKADIVCLTSPMGNAELTAMLKKYITGIQQYFNAMGDEKVSHYFFSRSFNDGCGGHPSMAQHTLIAAELTTYIKQLKNW
jgi:lysophospholipase L1-like esterase